tara:strand:+ start:2450 stop:3592 length:1143 start_codon:yes stop_codon:yes gene_type:complete
MKLFYWSPFLSNIATIDAVINSINSLKKYDKNKKYITSIIDSSGEWQEKVDKLGGINIIKLYKKNYYEFLPRGNFLKSRFSQTVLFFRSFNLLKRLLIREKPDYLIAHLIVSLPLILFFFFKFDTKLIIRISGTPKLNFWRRIAWSLLSKNIHLVTCPTQSTLNKFVDLRVFPQDKLKLLYDPILNIKSINTRKFEKLDDKFKGIKFILGIGRLTKQKNFSLLINSFKEILKRYPNLRLIILGDGEEKHKLNRLVKQLSLEKEIFLEGYKENIFNFIYNCECYISSSLYEDPGFTLIEAGFLNKTVIAADSKTGTTEILNNSKNGFLFENNNKKSLIDEYFLYKKMDSNQIKKKKINLKNFSKNFSFFNHYKNLNQILSN